MSSLTVLSSGKLLRPSGPPILRVAETQGASAQPKTCPNGDALQLTNHASLTHSVVTGCPPALRVVWQPDS